MAVRNEFAFAAAIAARLAATAEKLGFQIVNDFFVQHCVLYGHWPEGTPCAICQRLQVVPRASVLDARHRNDAWGKYHAIKLPVDGRIHGGKHATHVSIDEVFEPADAADDPDKLAHAIAKALGTKRPSSP